MNAERHAEPPVPFRPEPEDVLRASYPRAVAAVFDVEGVELGSVVRPGECPANVFDFQDGLRLIVSRERFPGGEVCLHVSASPRTNSRLWFSVKKGRLTLEGFLAVAREAWGRISGDVRPLQLAGLSPGKGVPHWYIPE